MKRSTNVALTLLIPAMAAFGCTQESTPATGRVNATGGWFGEDATADCDVPAMPGEPDKPSCSDSVAAGHARTTTYHRGMGWRSFLFGALAMSGSRTSHTRTTTGIHHSSAPSHSSSHITHGGFGGTGSHLSGGT